MLAIRDLQTRNLSQVTFNVAQGECVAVRGVSGSGKSLLLRAVADLDPAPGEVSLSGEDRFSMSGADWRRKVRYFAAEPAFWADKVSEHFHDQSAAAELLTTMGFSDDVLSWRVDRLSTGEKQRIALARGLVDGPRVLLLDEPTSGLDAKNAKALETEFVERLKAGVCALLVTHDPKQAKRLCKRVLTIKQGRLEAAAA